MSIYDWLLQHVFNSLDLTVYGDVVVYTAAVVVILFIALTSKALLHVFDIFFR